MPEADVELRIPSVEGEGAGGMADLRTAIVEVERKAKSECRSAIVEPSEWRPANFECRMGRHASLPLRISELAAFVI